jgi:hypothetical protein
VEKKQLSGAAVDNIITEITLLKLLKHEYIVEMKDFQWDERFVLYSGLYKIKKLGRKEHSPDLGTMRRLMKQGHKQYCELNIQYLSESVVC